jgi:hypothetical protein
MFTLIANGKLNAPYVDDVFSTYLYTGTGAANTINNGINLLTYSESIQFNTPTTMNNSTSAVTLNSVAYSASLNIFVAVGYNGANYPVFATSTDGSTWTTPALMNGSTTIAYLRAVSFTYGIFIAVGFNNSTMPVYATSANGTSWTTPASWGTIADNGAARAIAVNSSGKMVVVGSNSMGEPVFSTSVNGTSWTTMARMNGSTTAATMRSVAVNSAGKFVAVGYDNSSYPVFATSTDGSTWTTPATINGTTTVTYMFSVTYSSVLNKFVAVGRNSTMQPMFATSTDGSTWTTPAVMNNYSLSASMMSVIVNSAGKFVAVGFNNSTYPVFATSTDGSTWTTPTVFSSSTLAVSSAVLKTGYNDIVVVGVTTQSYPAVTIGTYPSLGTYSGGLVWIKDRSRATAGHVLYDTIKGGGYFLTPSGSPNGSIASTAAYSYGAGSTDISFTSSGFKLGTDTAWAVNNYYTSDQYVSWTFRKAAKFFDIVTYTGDGTISKLLNHSLTVAPGMVIIKNISTTSNWGVWHAQGRGAGLDGALALNLIDAAIIPSFSVSETTFRVYQGTSNFKMDANISGNTYVAYLFAHDTSANGVIQCGSFTTGVAGTTTSVNLGWEPQYVLIKGVGASNWLIIDAMRGWSNSLNADQMIQANSSGAENVGNEYGNPTAVGFDLPVSSFGAATTWIYMAIRRPNKPPTTGTQVFNAVSCSSSAQVVLSGFPIDTAFWKATNISELFAFMDRLRGSNVTLASNSSQSEADLAYFTPAGYYGFDQSNGFRRGLGSGSYINYFFKRAPGFFDVVCYTATATTVKSHSLGVPPEFVLVKNRSQISNWSVAHFGSDKALYLESNIASYGLASATGISTPTASSITLAYSAVNNVGDNYVAYLFATLAGISKVGSYTGNGTSQNINCGFAAGSRFVLIKRTDSTGDWYVWDTARGIVTANDPHLSLNTTTAEVTTDDSIDPYSAGFAVNQVAATNINVTSAIYIYLAIA